MIFDSEQLLRDKVRTSNSPKGETTNGGHEFDLRETHNPHSPKQPGRAALQIVAPLHIVADMQRLRSGTRDEVPMRIEVGSISVVQEGRW